MHAFTQYAGQKFVLCRAVSFPRRRDSQKGWWKSIFFTVGETWKKFYFIFLSQLSVILLRPLIALLSLLGALFRPSLSLSDVLEWSAERERGKMALGGIWFCCVLCLFCRLFALGFAPPMTRFACEKTASRLLCFCTNSIINADGDRDATFIIHFYIPRADCGRARERCGLLVKWKQNKQVLGK